MHPYRLVLHQALSTRDYDNRLDFCHWLLDMVAENPLMLSQILWTDEATFNSDGHVNLHNTHYWCNTNPHWMRESHRQGRWSINVWCGILGDKIIGPYVFNEPLNGETYLNFLINVLPLFLEDIPLDIRRNMIFQHDGCPAHYYRNVQQFLNDTFPNRWIGRGSIFPWPARYYDNSKIIIKIKTNNFRSPDLTCLDFYLWGRLKDLVYVTQPTTREDMVARIENSIRSISSAEIETAVFSTIHRMQQCVENDGRQFEHLRH